LGEAETLLTIFSAESLDITLPSPFPLLYPPFPLFFSLPLSPKTYYKPRE